MSRMIFTDSVNILAEHAQPIGGNTQARKILKAPKPDRFERGRLFLLARKARAGASPLTIHVNDRRAAAIKGASTAARSFSWYEVAVPKAAIKAGNNEIVLSSKSSQPYDWYVALTATVRPAKSYVSVDRGKNWTNTHLGRFSAVTGEYIVRLRLDDGTAVKEPKFIAEDPDNSELRRLRKSLPSSLTNPRLDTFTRAKRLCSRIACSFMYFNTSDAPAYSPWNYWQILQTNAENIAAVGRGESARYIVMCVHFAVAFVQAATALGITARCAVSTGAIGKPTGHFFPEVWLGELGRWGKIDPTVDIHFVNDDGIPLAGADVYPNRARLKDYARYGRGWEHQKKRNGAFVKDMVLTSMSYRCIGYWRRNDFFSHPEAAPTRHGSITYFEPEIVWTHGTGPALAAFPYDCRGC